MKYIAFYPTKRLTSIHSALLLHPSLRKSSTPLVNSAKIRKIDCGKIRKIFDKTYRHLCGHSSSSYIKLILQQNHMYNDDVKKYLSSFFDKCVIFATTFKSDRPRKVNLSAIFLSFTDVACIDHDHLGGPRILETTSCTARY